MKANPRVDRVATSRETARVANIGRRAVGAGVRPFPSQCKEHQPCPMPGCPECEGGRIELRSGVEVANKQASGFWIK